MRRQVLVGAALIAALVAAPAFAPAATAAEIEPPKVTISAVDWVAAAAALKDAGDGTPAEQFARLNTATDKRFPGIAGSSVPVLAPFDLDAFKVDKSDAETDK